MWYPFELCAPFCAALALAGTGLSMEAVPVVGQIVGTSVIGAAVGVVIYRGVKWLASSHDPELTPIGDGNPTPDDMRRVNEFGGRTGCIACGTAAPGTKAGNGPVNYVSPRTLRIPRASSQSERVIVRRVSDWSDDVIRLLSSPVSETQPNRGLIFEVADSPELLIDSGTPGHLVDHRHPVFALPEGCCACPRIT